MLANRGKTIKIFCLKYHGEINSAFHTSNTCILSSSEVDGAGYSKGSELWNAILVVEDCHLHVNKEVSWLRVSVVAWWKEEAKKHWCNCYTPKAIPHSLIFYTKQSAYNSPAIHLSNTKHSHLTFVVATNSYESFQGWMRRTLRCRWIKTTLPDKAKLLAFMQFSWSHDQWSHSW